MTSVSLVRHEFMDINKVTSTSWATILVPIFVSILCSCEEFSVPMGRDLLLKENFCSVKLPFTMIGDTI